MQKFPTFLSDCKLICIFWTYFSESLPYRISPKSVQWGAELIHADRQIEWERDREADMMKLLGAFCVYANMSKTFINNGLHVDSRLSSSEVKMHNATSLQYLFIFYLIADLNLDNFLRFKSRPRSSTLSRLGRFLSQEWGTPNSSAVSLQIFLSRRDFVAICPMIFFS